MVPILKTSVQVQPAIREILEVVSAQQMQISGAMFVEHLTLSDTHFDFEVGFPVTAAISPDGRVRTIELPAMRAPRPL